MITNPSAGMIDLQWNEEFSLSGDVVYKLY